MPPLRKILIPHKPQEIDTVLNEAWDKRWVVYAKKPFAGRPKPVLEYLGRYTHRIAISNHRIVSIDDRKVIIT